MDNRVGNILIVDGSVQSTYLISHWLRMEDLIINTAESGINAFAKVNLLIPDIVISNVVLPDISGFDLCKRVKSNLRTPDTLVLLFSSLKSETNRVRAEEIDADDYIEDISDQYQLISKVRSLRKLNRLSYQLRKRYAELEEQNRTLSMELEMATQVQRALIPQIDMRINETVLLSRYYPAMGIGGDFYNIIPLSENSFVIVMGDISGHGIAASLLTAVLNMIIKNLAQRCNDPGLLLHHLNKELYGMFKNMTGHNYSASVFCALVNTQEKYIRYSNSGLCFPLYVDVDQNIVTELDSVGTPIGMFKESLYTMRVLMYTPGDLLLLHTDGLQDTFYKKHADEFTRHIMEILSRIRNYASLEEMLNVLSNEFYIPGASEAKRMAHDDCTMIICKL
ncbi:MAG: fused response regulator/phosphatase [Clostridiales bacterium]|jgi:sigma-B regulation protein RsbU (phosphoserine phosphatase)|nr:fused response regulator/phosphatase [Clostridiales bacterium]